MSILLQLELIGAFYDAFTKLIGYSTYSTFHVSALAWGESSAPYQERS